jgi:large subunit ribosomal protein L10
VGGKSGGGKMPNTKKIFIVQNLTEKFNQARGLIFTDYSGLEVPQINDLRKNIKKAGGEFEVVKNNLIRLAAQNCRLSTNDWQLTGPTAILWIYNQNLSPIKILNNFIKQNELPKIKFGFWEGEKIDEKRINELANLPGVDQLRGQLLAFLTSPTFRLTNALSWNLKKLILVLKAIKVDSVSH